MKKFNYERPQVSIVDYELDRNIAGGSEEDFVSVHGVKIDVQEGGVNFP